MPFQTNKLPEEALTLPQFCSKYKVPRKDFDKESLIDSLPKTTISSMKGRPIRIILKENLEIWLKKTNSFLKLETESFFKKEETKKITKICPRCRGIGKTLSYSMMDEICPRCNGRRFVEDEQN